MCIGCVLCELVVCYVCCCAGDELKDSQIHRSVCFAYSIMILVFIVRYSEHVHWLEIYGHKLLNFIEHGILDFFRFIFILYVYSFNA